MLFFLLCIILFCFYSLFILFQHYFKDYKRHLVAGRPLQPCQSFSKGTSLPTRNSIKITLMTMAFSDM